MRRREAIKLAAASAATTLLGSPAIAQTGWPDRRRTVRVIVPFPPGAANDALGRLFADRLRQKYGVTVVVENRAGASGWIGTRSVITADPDGYTLLASAFNTAVMPMVVKGAVYDPEADLEAMARTAIAPLILVMSAARPQRDLRALIAAARANPRDWMFAVSAPGSAGHLATLMFAQRTGVPFEIVPYRGTAPALLDVASGNVHLMMDPTFALLPSANDGTRVRGLAIASRARSPLAPDLPTFAEGGIDRFEFNSWYGIWGPKGTPREVSDRVNELVQETMRDPEIVARLATTLLEPVAESIDDTKRFIASEIARARELLTSVGFTPE
ncbi:MAG: Bug family tripartite tricarboxylate transporter substrate binding protein [Tagaea sp.]